MATLVIVTIVSSPPSLLYSFMCLLCCTAAKSLSLHFFFSLFSLVGCHLIYSPTCLALHIYQIEGGPIRWHKESNSVCYGNWINIYNCGCHPNGWTVSTTLITFLGPVAKRRSCAIRAGHGLRTGNLSDLSPLLKSVELAKWIGNKYICILFYSRWMDGWKGNFRASATPPYQSSPFTSSACARLWPVRRFTVMWRWLWLNSIYSSRLLAKRETAFYDGKWIHSPLLFGLSICTNAFLFSSPLTIQRPADRWTAGQKVYSKSIYFLWLI